MALPSQKTELEPPSGPALSINDPSLLIDRELSLLAFQRRVLEEARDPENPLLERVKFLSILFSNLDELFMVRVAALKQKLASNAPDGVADLLDKIRSEVKRLNEDAYGIWQHLLLEIQQAGIDLRDYADLSEMQRRDAQAYFHQVVYPVLTPLAVDRGRPFPHISNLSLNLAVTVRDARGLTHFARVKIPDTLPQIVTIGMDKAVPHLASPAGPVTAQTAPPMIWLEQLVSANLNVLFPGLEIVEVSPFRVTRDAEVAIQELESDDLLETVEEAIWQRRFRAVVRLQVSRSIPREMLDTLVDNLEIDPRDVDYVDGPLDLSRLRALGALDRPELKDAPFVPHTPAELHLKSEEDIFSVIRREDVLLHHPYDSFQPVVEFLRRAAADPDVLAIKMTLYRVGRNSPVVEALVNAIENGKQVAVMVELKARFDEESNIEWAKALEAEGVHVVYGLIGLKVHSKVALVVRREGERIRRYVHLGTGNYNPTTARLYTDLSLFTADEQIGADASDLFNYVTGYSGIHKFRKLLVAPISLRSSLETLIRREIEHARNGMGGQLIFKMNSLEDPAMIRLLYEASQGGVRIDLIVRGICCLRPGVPGVSENIHVRSIVGRFLEHSRIYYFGHGAQPEIYLGSADLMGRNLDHRVEVLFPVQSKRLVHMLFYDVLKVYLSDNRSTRIMNSDGSFTWDKTGEPAIDCQARFLNVARVTETPRLSSV